MENQLAVQPTQQLLLKERVDVYIGQFLGSLDVKPVSRDTYRKALKRFSQWIVANNITSPTREDILAYKEALKSFNLSAMSISSYIVAVRRFFAYLEGLKIYPNVAKDIKGEKRPKGYLRDALTPVQVQRLLSLIPRDSLSNLRDYALINLLLHTGMRTIEAVMADAGDIRNKDGETVLWVLGKSRDSKDEFVVLTPEAYNPIVDYLSARGNAEPASPLFVSHARAVNNCRLTTRSIRAIVVRWLTQAGLHSDRISSHSLRHTAASTAFQNGADPVSVQQMLRHANINTTMIYVHNMNRIKNAAEKLVTYLPTSPI